jgi:hypothetical protein
MASYRAGLGLAAAPGAADGRAARFPFRLTIAVAGAAAHNGGMRGMRPDGRIRTTLTRLGRAVVDRFMRLRGHPPEEAGVREPRRPRPTLPAASVALLEPRTSPHRRLWFR